VIHLSANVSGKVNLPEKQTAGHEVDLSRQETNFQTMFFLFEYLYNY